VVWTRVPAGHVIKNDWAGEALSHLPDPTGPREWLHDSQNRETLNMVMSLAGSETRMIMMARASRNLLDLELGKRCPVIEVSSF
jgi:hypothetical protein